MPQQEFERLRPDEFGDLQALVPAPLLNPSPVAKVGERVEVSGMAITVNEVKRPGTLAEFAQGEKYANTKPSKPNYEFLVVNVTIESVAPKEFMYNPAAFHARDGDGYEYDVCSQSYGLPRHLALGLLATVEKSEALLPSRFQLHLAISRSSGRYYDLTCLDCKSSGFRQSAVLPNGVLCVAKEDARFGYEATAAPDGLKNT